MTLLQGCFNEAGAPHKWLTVLLLVSPSSLNPLWRRHNSFPPSHAATSPTPHRYESSELYWRLFDCGVPVKHLVYNKVGHGDFVTAWPTAFTNSGGSSSNTGDDDDDDDEQAPAAGSAAARRARWLQQLPPYCRDLAVVVGGVEPVQFVERRRVHTLSSNGNGGPDAARLARHQQPAAAAEEAADATVLLQSDLN